jgi:hypothetical protein
MEDCGWKTAQTNILTDPNLQNNQSKRDWRCGSSSRVPALQVGSSNPSPTKKKKKKQEREKGGGRKRERKGERERRRREN